MAPLVGYSVNGLVKSLTEADPVARACSTHLLQEMVFAWSRCFRGNDERSLAPLEFDRLSTFSPVICRRKRPTRIYSHRLHRELR